MASLASTWVRPEERDTPFERLFAAEYSRVVAIAHRVVGDAHEAEDVAQEVFCSFFRAHSPEASYASAWLHRAAIHTALNGVRGRKRRKLREEMQASAERRLGADEAALDPLRVVQTIESRREVREALGRLPEKSAAVLALRYSGLSYAEVAAALGVRVGQVGTLLRRAEVALRKELTNETR